MYILKNIFAYLSLSFVFLIVSFSTVHSQEVNDSTNVSINANGEELGSIVNKVYEQTGYVIDVKEDWNTLPVKGNYVQVPLERFLARIFKGRNVSIISDSDAKIYYVRLFGEKIDRKDLGSAHYDSSAEEDSFIEQEIVDIKDLHDKQKQELLDYIADPNAVDPVSGMRLSMINSLHEDQKNEVEEIRKTVEYQEINELHNSQRNQLKEDLENKATKDPVSQMSLEDIEELHQYQLTELEEIKNNPDTVVDDTGMTLGELKELHEKQRQQRKRIKF